MSLGVMIVSDERWRPVVGFEGMYEVSDYGRVRSLPRCVICSGAAKGTYPSTKKGRILRPGPMSGGHLSVALGRNKSHCVHELVLRAFLGPRPGKMEARHLDGDETNNRFTNLVWDTRGNNGRDKKWHKGTTTGKLKPNAVLRIRRAFRTNYRGLGTELAAQFGVSPATISKIKLNLLHTDVGDGYAM